MTYPYKMKEIAPGDVVLMNQHILLITSMRIIEDEEGLTSQEIAIEYKDITTGIYSYCYNYYDQIINFISTGKWKIIKRKSNI